MLDLARLTDEQWRRNPAERPALAALIHEGAAAYYENFPLPKAEMLDEIASQFLAPGMELESVWVLRDGDALAGIAACIESGSLAVARQASLARFLKRVPRQGRRDCLARVQVYNAAVAPCNENGVYLARFAVSPQRRGRGAGLFMMRGLIEDFGGKTIALHVAGENIVAIALYHKCGFNGVSPAAYRFGLFVRPGS